MTDAPKPQPISDDALDQVHGGTNPAASTALGSRFSGDMNIPEMMMAIQLERSNILDSQIKDQMQDMQNRNNWLKDASAVLGEMRADRPAGEQDVASYGTVTLHDGTQARVEDWMKENGIQMDNNGDNAGFRSEFDTAINNLKSAIDTVNSQSQMDMVRLQGLMDKRNQAFDLMTDTLSKTSKNLDGIIGNMR